MIKKIISERKNKEYGYIVRKEQVDHVSFEVMTDFDTAIDNIENKNSDCNKLIEGLSKSDKPLILEAAYTPDGQYIGNEQDAMRLYKRGIKPELINKTYSVCSIGFSEKENKWYGWSHRAIFGFGIGSKVKKGDINYHANCEKDFIDAATLFYSGPNKLNIKSEVIRKDGAKKVQTTWIYDENTPNKKLRGTEAGVYTPFPDKYGRGEWQAKTLENAKEMAIDFARGVS